MMRAFCDVAKDTSALLEGLERLSLRQLAWVIAVATDEELIN